MFRRALILAAAALALNGGCAKPRRAISSPATAPAVATRPALDAKAYLSLAEIEPKPVLPTTSPATATSAAAPLDAIMLYAKARDALKANQRFSAINLIEQAIKLDPYSFELRRSLAEAYQGANSPDKTIEALEAALRIDPNDLRSYLDLGKQHLLRGQVDRAVIQFRLATQCPAYGVEEDTTALVDYLLAKSLQQQGYDRAALDRYDALLRRLEHPAPAVRSNPELSYWLSRPELLYGDIAKLYERNGQLEQALTSYRVVAERSPDNLDVQGRIVRVLTELGRREEAKRVAIEFVRKSHAGADSVAALREVYRRFGDESQAVEELRRLYRENPADRSPLLASVDMLVAAGKTSEADASLAEAVGVYPSDAELFRRLFNLRDRHGSPESAARLVVETSAARPELARQLTTAWPGLMRSSRTNPLRVGDLSTMTVSIGAESARQFWIARLSAVGSRPMLSEAAMGRATEIDPLYPPAFRLKMGRIWSRADWDERRKTSEADALIDAARGRDDEALSAELRGMSLANQKRSADAIAAFEHARKLGNRSPDLQLSLAALHRADGNTTKFEQILWKVMSDHPGLAEAYLLLFQHYSGAGNANKALGVLQSWMLADPTSPQARLLRVNVLMQVRQESEAEQTLDSLLADQPEDSEVLATARELYARDNKLAHWTRRLEELRVKQPKNLVIVESLVDLYAESKRLAEGARVLDAAQVAIKDDPDLLYYLAHLYERVDDPRTTEQLLERVLLVNPAHVVASNDLGYSWADAGKHLERAEGLIRLALESEPDNMSYLDSLGWVLYKRGKFVEAEAPLTRAAGEGDAPDVVTDPVVLDHLGDTLYRLNRTQDAVKLWRKCIDRLGELDGAGVERPDLAKLRLQLRQKLRQADAGQPVKVAPVVDSANETKQANRE